MKQKKRAWAAAGAIAAFTLGGLAIAGPASAAVTPQNVYDCSAGYVCFWDGADYQATFYQRSTSGDLPVARRDKASSTSNRTSHTVRYFTGTGFTGLYISLGSGGLYRDLTGQGFNDAIESVQLQ